MNFNKNRKQVSCVKVPALMVSCKYYFAYLIQVKSLTLKNLSTLLIGRFLIEVTFSSQMSTFLEKFESSLEVQRAKKEFSDNLGHNILELQNILAQIRFTKSKRKLDIQYSKLRIRVVQGVAKRLKTQDLRKLENIRKISNLGGHIAQCQSPIRNLDFPNSN